jgi:hypothetical protein
MTARLARLIPSIPGIGRPGVPSARYAAAFNTVSAQQKAGIFMDPSRLAGARSLNDVMIVHQGAKFLIGEAPDIEMVVHRIAKARFGEGPSFQNQLAVMKQVVGGVEEGRRALVEESANYHQHDKRTPPPEMWALLNRTEQAAVRLFKSKVAPIIARIEARQQNHNARALEAAMAKDDVGEPSRRIFSRIRNDLLVGAQYQGKPLGSLHPAFPDRVGMNGMIGPGWSAKRFAEKAATLDPHHEMLRPTTVVEDDGTVIPISQHEDFKDDYQALAEALDVIATLKIGTDRLNPKVVKQLKLWRNFYRSGTAIDEALAVQATIDAGEEDAGLLRIHIGPSESYWADAKKFPELLMVGIRDPKLARKMKERQQAFLALEASLTGIANYTPRTLSLRGGYADPMWTMVTAGFIYTFQYGEPMALNFPNYPYPGVEGTNNLIMTDVALSAIKRAQFALANVLKVNRQPTREELYVALINFVVAHETGHSSGPQRQHKVPDGRNMADAFNGEKPSGWGDSDELKADMTAAAQTALLSRADIPELRAVWELLGDTSISREVVENDVIALLGSSLSKKYKGKELFMDGTLVNHAFGTMVQVSYLWKSGALTREGDRLRLDFDKALAAMHELRREIIKFQAVGDAKGYYAFAHAAVEALPDEIDELLLRLTQGEKDYFVDRELPAVA